MTDPDEQRRQELVALIGRLEHTLEVVDQVLAVEQPDPRDRERAREAIAKRRAEIAEVFPPEERP